MRLVGKIIALINQKGGVGKTTTSINLSASLGLLNKKVLLVDLDPQCNSSTGLGVYKSDYKYNIYDAIIGAVPIQQAITTTKFKNLDIIPSSLDLAGLDSILMEKAKNEPSFSKGGQLKLILRQINQDYDFIIIDCPPSLGLLTTNALTAVDSVIIPVQCEYFALEGVTQLLNSIILAQRKLNPKLDIEGVLLTMLDSRTNLGFEVVEDIRRYFKERVYDTIIPRLVKISEAPSHGKPIIEYDPGSKGAIAYLNLAKEVIIRNGK